MSALASNPRWRLAWFGAAVFVIVFGIGEFARWVVEAWGGTGWWGIDLQLVLDAGGRLGSASTLYADPKFLYPPLAAVIGRPLASLPFDALGIAYALAKVAIATVAVWFLAPAWSIGWRLLAATTLVASLPFVHDVMLGNANVLLVGAMVPAVFASPRPRNGLWLGLAVAVFAKPLVVPVLLWLLVWRPRVLLGSVAAGLGATALGVLVAPPLAYVEWIRALAGGTRFAAPFEGNHGVTALVPELWLPIAAITAVGLLLVLWRRGAAVGLVWAVASGILLAPYAGTYSALPVALALPVVGPLAPVLALLIVAVSPIATTHPLPVYAGAILVAALRLPDREGERRSWPLGLQGAPAPRRATAWPALALARPQR